MSHVAIYGDAGVDLYWIGTATTLSAEAPVPVMKQTRTLALPGMAGNVHCILKQLGVSEVTLLEPEGANHPIKNRLMLEDGTQLARWDVADYCQPAHVHPSLSVDAVVVCDYSKGAIDDIIRKRCLAMATGGVPVYVDTKADPFLWLGENITLFPNQKEYATWEQHYQWMPQVVHKMGAQGVRYLRYGEPQIRFFAECSAPMNVCGAGDVVLAAYVAMQLQGASTEGALHQANVCAGQYVSQSFMNRNISL